MHIKTKAKHVKNLCKSTPKNKQNNLKMCRRHEQTSPKKTSRGPTDT